MISGAQFDLSQFSEPKNNSKKPKLDNAYLSACLRIIELQNKDYTNLEEDLEMQLLKEDANSQAYIERITKLAFKQDKSAREIKELNLLMKPETRNYADRILELDDIANKNAIQDIESTVLNTPQLRVHYARIMSLVIKLFTADLNSEQEARACFLFTNKYSVNQAEETLYYESLPTLTALQMDKLGSNYLCRICEIPMHLSTNIHKNFSSAAYNPSNFCFTYNKNLPTYQKPIASYISVKKAIEDAAQHLAEKYYMHELTQKTVMNTFKEVSTPIKMFQTNAIQNLIKSKQELLSLVLKKIFFDFDAGFAESKLNKLVIHLSKEIDENRLQLTAKGLTEMYKTLQESLNRIGIDDNNQSLRRR